MTSAADLIREARNQLFERGWCKGDLKNHAGEVCAVGALDEAWRKLCLVGAKHSYSLLVMDEHLHLRVEARRAALNAAHSAVAKAAGAVETLELFAYGASRTLTYEHENIPLWNDAPERTFDEVIDAFDRAEKIAEADAA